jgi:hypothetical protein
LMADLFGSPERDLLADKDPEEYYKKTPFARSLWEGRLPTWLGQAYEQDVEPAIDKLPSPTTMEGALTYAKLPYSLLKAMGTGAFDTIKSSMDDPTNARKALELSLMITGGGGLLGRVTKGPGQVLGMSGGRGAKTADLGKMTTAQKMLDDPMDEARRMARAKETAEMRRKGNIERFGYDPNDAASTAAFKDTSYRMQHQPRGPDSDDPIRLDELTRSTNGNTAGYPDDFYGPDGSKLYAPGPRFSGDESGISNIESYNIAKKVRGNPDGVVTIYRAVPNEDKINKINQGDFVTLSPKYAEVHGSSGYGRSGNDPGKIISEEVKVKDVYWAGDDINEFGYFPQSSTRTPKEKPSPAMLRALLKDPDVI